MKTQPATVLQTSLRFGLIGGGAAVLFALVGMVEVFGQRTIISGVVSMGQAFLAAAMLLSAFAAARQFSTIGARAMLTAGGLTGAIVGAMLAALVFLGTSINIRDVFVSASPPLFGGDLVFCLSDKHFFSASEPMLLACYLYTRRTMPCSICCCH